MNAEAGDGYVDLTWAPPNPAGSGDLEGSWNLTYDWFCSGAPGGPTSAEFFEDGTGVVDGINVIWGGGDTIELGDGLCPGVGEYTYNAYFQFVGYTTFYYFNIDGDFGEGYMDDAGYNGTNVDGETTIARVGIRESENPDQYTSKNISLSDDLNVVSAFADPEITVYGDMLVEHGNSSLSSRDLIS